MNGILLIGSALLVAVLLVMVVVVVSKGIRSGKIGAGAAKLLAFMGVLVALGLFVLLMGVLKNLQG